VEVLVQVLEFRVDVACLVAGVSDMLGVLGEFRALGVLGEFRELGVFGMLGEFDMFAFAFALALALALACALAFGLGFGPLAGVLTRWILVGHSAHCDRLTSSVTHLPDLQ